MTVDTKQVTRRQLEFSSWDDVLQEVDSLEQGPIEAMGNWTPTQIFRHLAKALHGAIDGIPGKRPWFSYLIGKMILRSILKKGMPAGFKLTGPAAQFLICEDQGEVAYKHVPGAACCTDQRIRNT